MSTELQLANCARFKWIPWTDTKPTRIRVWKHCNDERGKIYPAPMESQSNQEACEIVLERYLSEGLPAGKVAKLTIHHYGHINNHQMILTWSSK